MIEDLIRGHLKQFEPYHSARSEAHDARILLDANELSLGSPVVFDGIALNRYPDPAQEVLRARLATQSGLEAERIFVGVGSDEVIDLLIRLVCEPAQDEVVIAGPTYGVYRVSAEINAVRVSDASLTQDFQLDVDGTRRSCTANTKIIFCCSPNNPTGNLLRRTDILKLCELFSGLVVVDEAYVEFAGGPSLAGDVDDHENLVLLRTLSKAWGMAGVRCGYCIAAAPLISHLLMIKSPYNMNSVSASLACRALDNVEFFRQSVSLVVGERERMAQSLAETPGVTRVYPSNANFLLVEFQEATEAYAALYRGGIVVRRRAESRLKSCLRITIGTPDENDLVLRALKGQA